MTCTLGACAGEGSNVVVGVLTACIVFFAFLVGSLGGLMGALFCQGVCGNIFGPVPKNIMEGTDCANLFVTHLNWCTFKRTYECL